MPASEVRVLAQLQFILSDAVGRLLGQMPYLIRRLSTTTVTELEVNAERIRGAIRWGETYSTRAATGTPQLFVTAPTQRVFDTAENRVLVFALRAIAEFGRQTGWVESAVPGPAAVVRKRVGEAVMWLQARPFADLPNFPPTPRTLSRVRAGRHRRRYQAALDVVDLWSRYIAQLDRAAIRRAVEEHGLVATRDSVLLELQCAFAAIRIVGELGWAGPPIGLLRPPVIFHGTKGGSELTLYYQHTPPRLSVASRYRELQKTHAFASTSGLIPDLAFSVKCAGQPERWLLIEAKGGPKRRLEQSARAALLDLLAYRRAFDYVLAQQGGTYGIGYAWGSELTPAADGEIVLCTPDTFRAALEPQLS
jgi:hypothetical protein